MLRRRLMVIFGSLVIVLVAMAASAVFLLQHLLTDLNRVNSLAATTVEQTSRLNSAITMAEIDLYHLQSSRNVYLDGLIRDVEEVRDLAAALGSHDLIHEPGIEPLYQALCQKLPEFERAVSSLATARDPELARRYNIQSLVLAVELRNDILQIDQDIHGRARVEQANLAGRFRWVVLGMAIGGLLVIDLAIIFLLRTASMVLRPLDRLVEASRELSHEHFDFRASVGQHDEFDELARAYNSLAERVQSAEQRKMEMLTQVAATLNHELNNAIATVEMQLAVLARRSGGDPKVEKCLRQMADSLHRMAQTVESLKRIRRIVLTDYIEGVKMLDLKQSVEDETTPEPAVRN